MTEALSLETITGTLASGVKQLSPESFQTSAELSNERRTNLELRDRWFYTANIGLYKHDETGNLLYGLGGREAFNSITSSAVDPDDDCLKGIDAFCNQLLTKHNYTLTADQNVSLDGLSSDIVWVNSSELRLQGDDEWRYFEIDTENYGKAPKKGGLNKAERVYAEKVFGTGNDFVENMAMLKHAGKTSTMVYVLNPEYVKSRVKEGEIVARAGWLDVFFNNSRFIAYDRDVNYDIALRGVR